jgi:hypothetical protein
MADAVGAISVLEAGAAILAPLLSPAGFKSRTQHLRHRCLLRLGH